MSSERNDRATDPFPLSEEEAAIVEFYRALKIDQAEALRRLATPATAPILPMGQELQANMPVAAEILIVNEIPPTKAGEPR